MGKSDLRFRQIHLDFHTSEHIAGIGSEFDPEEFALTLERARVNSVTCFARGHHGWIYYDTTAFPERRHPHLGTDLLREQIEACHARGIRVPIYITVQWDHYTARERPEWLVVDERGCPVGTPPYEAGFYRKLCLNSPYVDFLKASTQEVLQTLPTDGIFFDIVQPQDCSCRYCRAKMKAEGIEPSDATARQRFGLRSVNDFKRSMTRFVREFDEGCTIFYNAGHIGTRHRVVADAYTHFELESLPSGGWGYMHFPITMRYARKLGLDCLGMTGKFHTSWGDFHSFKNEEALQYECFQMLALGAKCSVGDQLHPLGPSPGPDPGADRTLNRAPDQLCPYPEAGLFWRSSIQALLYSGTSVSSSAKADGSSTAGSHAVRPPSGAPSTLATITVMLSLEPWAMARSTSTSAQAAGEGTSRSASEMRRSSTKPVNPSEQSSSRSPGRRLREPVSRPGSMRIFSSAPRPREP